MNRKWLSIAAVTALSLSMTACSNSDNDNNNSDKDPSSLRAATSTTHSAIAQTCGNVGGVAIFTGFDTNGNGTLDEAEYESAAPQVVCNGQDGASGSNGQNSLIKVTEESTQCTSGGLMLEVGTDGNANGILDASEITDTQYVCNGNGSPVADENRVRKPGQSADELIVLADGLSVDFLTREAGNKTDMMAFWPKGDAPTHLITCVEGSTEDLANGKKNPSVQSISLADGTVSTLLRGMSRCDGIRTTDWGTVLATEEAGDGQAYEIIDPLNVSEHTITDRAAGTIIDASGVSATKIVKRDALATMAWEGLTVLPSGVVIGGDELRPGSGVEDSDGGAIFKFVPTTIRTVDTEITDLADSPFVAGKNYAMQVQCKEGASQYGQGCEVGNAIWIEVDGANARSSANEKGATGYYRPEDLHTDPTYTGEGVRFCWANTGNEGAEHYGEVLCGVDTKPTDVSGAFTVVNRFVEGDPDFNAHDNLAFQPISGNLYVIEDHSHGDIFACLPDGTDRDIKTDGCVKLLSLNDTSAEPTGFTFSPDGKTAYVSIQHSNDTNMELVDGYATDDVLVISGFSVPSKEETAKFGAARDEELHNKSGDLFGFTGAKTASHDTHVARNTTTAPSDVIDLATGLSATFLTREAGHKTDMMAFWPKGDAPTHLITCVEGSAEEINATTGKKNPSVQSINLTDGTVSTLLRGMSRCDGIRTTDWGTVLATEESGDGQAYEIIDPLSVANHTVTDRAAGTIVSTDGTTPSANIVKRDALPTMSWEGLTVLPSGVVIGGDELRPGSYSDASGSDDTDGGAIFKFIPTTPRTATSNIATLAESPLTAGKTYAMQVQCKNGASQYGQGCEIGNAIWIEVDGANARISADEKGATGYYRPEDLHADPTYAGEGVRFCWANTGRDGASNYGEVICGVDTKPTDVSDSYTIVNRFIEGDTDLNAPDNLAFQPVSGNLYVIEDHGLGDIFACLPDGADRDIKSDGCIRLLSIKDSSAEPTGFTFSPDGKTAYVSIQHSNDTGMPNVDDYATDDVIKITGFTVPKATGFDQVTDFGESVEKQLSDNSKELFGFGTPIVHSSAK